MNTQLSNKDTIKYKTAHRSSLPKMYTTTPMFEGSSNDKRIGEKRRRWEGRREGRNTVIQDKDRKVKRTLEEKGGLNPEFR